MPEARLTLLPGPLQLGVSQHLGGAGLRLRAPQSLAVSFPMGVREVLALGVPGLASGALLLALAPALRGEKGDPGSALETYTAASALSGHVAVTLDASGYATPADCRSAAHAAALCGVTTGAALAGAPATVRRSGLLTSPGWGLTPGLPVVLGEDGALVQAAPPSAAYLKQIGVALSASSVLIDLQPAIFLT